MAQIQRDTTLLNLRVIASDIMKENLQISRIFNSVRKPVGMIHSMSYELRQLHAVKFKLKEEEAVA
ncbi:hypothetical protein [Candidatus Nitrososphaera gargensis]|nr:hypothetical protein [Candidatus Nitrososphaera gargensis]